VAALVQGGLIRPLSKRVADATLIRVGVLLQLVAFAGIAASPSFGRGVLYGASALLAVGNGFTQPSTSAYVSRRASASEQGATLGVYQSFSSLARMFGPAFGGFLYGAFEPRAPYIAAAIGMGIALAVALLLPSIGGAASPAGPTPPVGPLAEEAP
jgi:MFS family permease